MFRVLANDANNTFAFENLALVADPFDGSPDFHVLAFIIWPSFPVFISSGPLPLKFETFSEK